MQKIIIGIDPDITKNGVATIDLSKRLVSLQSLPFPNLIDYLRQTKEQAEQGGQMLIVAVEASWLISTHWHTSKYASTAKTAALGNSVGRNHETGRKIIECAKYYGLQTTEQRPLKKIWGLSRKEKINHAELINLIANAQYKASNVFRTNQEERDAALIAWHVANLPMRITIKNR